MPTKKPASLANRRLLEISGFCWLILDVNRDINTSWEVELFKLVHSRSGWLDDVDQALVRAENGSL